MKYEPGYDMARASTLLSPRSGQPVRSGTLHGVSGDSLLSQSLNRNAATVIRRGDLMLGNERRNDYEPRTEFGKKLMALRRAYIDNGGVLLNDDALEAELSTRRGGANA
jgi:hypothetical protein